MDIYDISHLTLNEYSNKSNSIDMNNMNDVTLLDTMNSLNIQEKFEPIETYYDYDRSNDDTYTDTNTDTNTHTNTHTHTYVESYIETTSETNSEIIRENTDEIDESEDFHEYDGYDWYDVPDPIIHDHDHDHNYVVSDDESNMLDKYDTSPYICFGIPNKYCQHYFDDEDFIFNRYDITYDIKKYIKVNNSIDEYTSHFCIGNGIIIDYNNSNDNPDIIYAKMLYIYTYINYYYKDLKDLEPLERIKHLPANLLYWVTNIITILKKVINDSSLKSHTFLTIEDVYFKELCYGLKIITHELHLLLNHYPSYSLWNLEEKHIKTFFKIVNNMCVILIFMKLNNRN